MAPRPHPTPPPRRLWAALGLALLAVSCGSADDAVTAGAGPGEAPLPTLPSVAERHSGQFDASGCAATPDGPDCSVTAGQIDVAQAGTAGPDPVAPAGASVPGPAIGDWRMLAGFVGPGWSTETTGAVVVLDTTVSSSTSGPWAATGLVRNQTDGTVGPVTVEADLLDGAGVSLGVVTGTVAVPALRAGEPGPFALRADPEVSAGSVASVRWAVRSEPDPEPPARDLELTVLRQRGLSDPRPFDMYLHHDPVSGAHPLVVFGTATTVGDTPVAGTRVVGAWMDAAGRVVALAHATLGVGGEPVDAADLEAGASADFALVVDAAGAPPTIDDAQLVLWGSGS